jgi:hypothetical protein
MTVVFVPSTRGGMLTRKLREREEVLAGITGFKIRFQEAGGSQLGNMFSTDLGKGNHCGRKCPPCDGSDSENRQNCKARNIVYETSCTICNPVDETPSIQREGKCREGVYIGETSRSLHERSLEHQRDGKSFSKKSHIAKHWMLAHPTINEMPTFNFKTIQMHKDCMSRQVGEAMRIYFSKDRLLNSKNEYLQICITRVVVQEETWETRVREKREEDEEKQAEARLIAFKELKQSIHLEVKDHLSRTTPTLDGAMVTGDALEGSEDSLRSGLDTTTMLEGREHGVAVGKEMSTSSTHWEDDQMLSSHQAEELNRGFILATPKRKALWPTLENSCKKRRLEMKRKDKSITVLSDMNISGWWRRMESMEPLKESNSKPEGRKHCVGQCDYKLAYMSLWWKRMERDEIKEKIDRTLGKRMKAFLMGGKMNVAEKISEKNKSGIQEHHQVRKVKSTGPSECLEKCSLTDHNQIVDSRTTPDQQECTILREHPPYFSQTN